MGEGNHTILPTVPGVIGCRTASSTQETAASGLRFVERETSPFTTALGVGLRSQDDADTSITARA